MKFDTVGSLRAFLKQRGWSPEELAARVGVSNMTWRRQLARRDSQRLPAKYQAVLERHFLLPDGLVASAGSASQVAQVLDPVSVVLAGADGSKSKVFASLRSEGAAVEAIDPLIAEVEHKSRVSRLAPTRLLQGVTGLLRTLPKASRAARALIVGGLVYFLNPFDLVADAILGIGYIDDLGVLMLIRERLSLPEETEAA